MLKKIDLMVASFYFALPIFAEMSETKRGTFDGIEWLYTVDYEAKRLVLEKAILLTAAQYEMEIDFYSVLQGCFGHSPKENEVYDVWIGASAFEGNEYLTGIDFSVWGPEINLTFSDNAFKGCVNLGSIRIGKWSNSSRNALQIRDIGNSAFEGCGEGEGVYYFNFDFGMAAEEYSLNSLTNIGERAFYGINKGYDGIELRLPETLVRLGAEAFADGRAFAKIVLPSSLENIEPRTFSGFWGEVEFPISGWKNIGESAFEEVNFYKWDKSECGLLRIPDGVETITDSAFKLAVGYDTLQLPNSLKKIGVQAFLGRPSEESWDKTYSSQLKGTVVIPESVESIGLGAFADNPLITSIDIKGSITNLPIAFAQNCSALETISLPDSLVELYPSAFRGCTNLVLTIPSSVKSLAWEASGYGRPKRIIFEGRPPLKIIDSGILAETKEIWVPAEYVAEWAPYMNGNVKIAKKVNGEWVALGGMVISNAMRASDPTIMDIKYKVTSTKDKVNVRILAYKNGVRSFANALPLVTFVDGTEANIGDGVAANVEHTVSWQVSKDWDVELAKVSVEVFVMEDNLLPLQLTTIPAKNGHPSVTFSRNEQSGEKVMNALYWLYADKTSDLTLENGVLKGDGKRLANGTTLSTENAVSYIYSKMGYGTLSGDTLKYVNDTMRTSISSGKFAVKEGAAE